MTDLRSWAKRWNDASLRQIANLPQRPSPRWPLVGMFAIGALTGALGVYAITQRTRVGWLAQLAGRATTSGYEAAYELDGFDLENPIPATTPRSNHRRKAAVEVR